MTVQIIGFPDAIAQDLIKLLNVDVVAGDFSSSAGCDLCILDSSAKSYGDLLDKLIAAQQPTIVIGDMQKIERSASYIELCSKPFRLESLRSMVERMIVSHQAIMLGTGWQFYPDYRYISQNEKSRIELTDKESDLLHLLYQQCPESVDKEQLLKSIWGYDEGLDTSTLETHIYRLRTKLEPLLQDGMELTTTNNGYALQQK